MKIFCYGSLKRGKHNHDFLRTAKYLGQACIKCDYSMFVVGLPILVKKEGGPGVLGELYEVDEKTLRQLDYLEGHQHLYERSNVFVNMMESDEQVEAQTYLYNGIISDKLKPKREYV